MSTEANKQIVKDFFAALSRGDTEAGFQLLADDMTWTVIGDTPVSGTYRGLKAIQEDFLGKVFQQIDHEAGIALEMVELIAEGDKPNGVVVSLRFWHPKLYIPSKSNRLHLSNWASAIWCWRCRMYAPWGLSSA